MIAVYVAAFLVLLGLAASVRILKQYERGGELGRASDVMMAHPLALQLRNLQTMVEIGVDKNSTIMFPAPLMSTIGELGAFLNRENTAAGDQPGAAGPPAPSNGDLIKAMNVGHHHHRQEIERCVS